MFFIIGLLIVIGSVIGGFIGAGGKLSVLVQPYEWLIICGTSIGAFLVANPKPVIKEVIANFGKLVSGPKHDRHSYMELLTALYYLFRLAKTKGDLALESHVEKPSDSPLFQKFPKLAADKHALEFLCDYLRLLTLGTANAHELEAVIDQELEAHHQQKQAAASAVTTVADGLPAIGIVAAVLGVIITMGSITEPPEVLGYLIGAALVGTFLGVLLAYGFVGPMGKSLEQTFEQDAQYLNVIKAGILAHMQGYAPQVSVEFARKVLPDKMRPSFAEVEDALGKVSVS